MPVPCKAATTPFDAVNSVARCRCIILQIAIFEDTRTDDINSGEESWSLQDELNVEYSKYPGVTSSQVGDEVQPSQLAI